jgi:hypothetical protein
MRVSNTAAKRNGAEITPARPAHAIRDGASPTVDVLFGGGESAAPRRTRELKARRVPRRPAQHAP